MSRTRYLILPTATLAAAAFAGSRSYSPSPLVPVSGVTPFSDLTPDRATEQEGQVFLNSAVEPHLAISSTNRRNLVAVWQQDRWSNGGCRGLASAASHDGGLTWEMSPIPGVTRVTGGPDHRASDPWVEFGADGRLFHIGLTTDTFGGLGTGASGFSVNRSFDGGRSWSAPTSIIRESEERFFNDKETLTADPADARYAYAVWDRIEEPADPESGEPYFAPGYFTRTTDGGDTWATPRPIYTPPPALASINHRVLVTKGGRLVDLFLEQRPSGRARHRWELSVLSSADRGESWPSRPRRVLEVRSRGAMFGDANGTYDPESGVSLRTADIIPSTAVNPRNGHLFVVWQDTRFSDGGRTNRPSRLYDDILFSRSTDGGKRWSKPVRVNQTPARIPRGNRQTFVPTVAVAEDGTLAVTYYDFRFNDQGQPLLTDHWAVFSRGGERSEKASGWGHEVRLTDQSFDMLQAPNPQRPFLGDYMGLVADGREFCALFTRPDGELPSRAFFCRLKPGTSGTYVRTPLVELGPASPTAPETTDWALLSTPAALAGRPRTRN